MGESFGRYILERKLASGGMAEVFLAKQAGPERFERLCVIKRMLPELLDGNEFVEMFLDEARLAAQLSHPNIAQTYDFGEFEGKYFLAMEYVPGEGLHVVIDEHRKRKAFVPLPLVARILAQAANALDYAHGAHGQDGAPLQLIHRDVSPENILLAQSGTVKLIDFGIAKAANTRQRTRTGFIKGKFLYMSPEQIHGFKLDHRSDIFSLGLVLYELLANASAVSPDNQLKAMESLAFGRIRPMEQYRTDLPPELAGILKRALTVERDQRYATAGEMSADLERYLVRNGQAVTAADLAQMLARVQSGAPLDVPAPRPVSDFVTDPEGAIQRPDEDEDDGRYDKTLINEEEMPSEVRAAAADAEPTPVERRGEGESESTPIEATPADPRPPALDRRTPVGRRETAVGWTAISREASTVREMPVAKRPSGSKGALTPPEKPRILWGYAIVAALAVIAVAMAGLLLFRSLT